MVANTAVKGTLVSFLVGITELSLDTAEVVDIKKVKSSPSYPDVIPKQMVVKVEKKTIESREVDFLIKFCPPGVIIVEASIALENILDERVFDIKRSLFVECRAILWEYHCDPYFDEEYSVYCVSDYKGDPENVCSPPPFLLLLPLFPLPHFHFLVVLVLFFLILLLSGNRDIYHTF